MWKNVKNVKNSRGWFIEDTEQITHECNMTKNVVLCNSGILMNVYVKFQVDTRTTSVFRGSQNS